jgi:mRNA-degrading endonuclease RelE of RelBE toxin-antitoxin system
MAFAIWWSRRAERFLSKLPAELARWITHKVNRVKKEPFHFLEHYEGADFYKLRIGR